ncbi:hypothetical protein H4S07_004210 [Coemansia furcata]|uniref:Uncharacterized protein n=1 Tax=Coemansia furcata TaxID=417177 RepID=A0ACC1LA72_9FUNG|nr:hypothetical protein H4S07_004210 [Coemansia furcata]
MDSPLSPSQPLPMLIVRKIVEYLENRSRASFSLDIDAHNKGKSVLTPLLSVSERWCAAALASICDNCLLSFDYPHKAIEVSFPAWPASVPYSQYRKTHLAKRVIISVALWKTCDGTFSDVVSRSQYENLSFPSANTLMLKLSNAECTTTGQLGSVSTPVAVANEEKVTSYVRSLLRLAPSVTDVIVSISSLNDKVPNSPQLYDTLVSELCRGSVKRVRVRSELKTGIVLIGLQRISALVSITQGPGMDSAPFAALAYLNKGTLDHLEIEVVTEVDWLTLLYGGTETMAVYSNLAWLALTVDKVPYTVTWAAIEDLAPFPALSTLGVFGGYPFDDDMLFRSNGNSLMNLHLPFGAMARNVLVRFKVLQRCGGIRMNSVRIGKVSVEDYVFMTERANVPIKQQMHHILGASLRLTLSDETIGLQLLGAIYAAPSTSMLQRLVFTNLVFDLGHIIRVIAALPSLVSFTCAVRGLHSNIRGIPATERPKSLRTKHYPLSVNFRELLVPYTAGTSAANAAIVAMQLAVLCPNFVYVELPPKLRNDFSREVAWAICNNSFEPYANSIRRLIYRDLDG